MIIKKNLLPIATVGLLVLSMTSCSMVKKNPSSEEVETAAINESAEDPVIKTETETSFDFKGSAPDIISVDEESVDYMEGRIASLTYTVNGPISSHIFQEIKQKLQFIILKFIIINYQILINLFQSQLI